ncbi:hypothetical protein NXS19_004185 [Fusarium pseudograminearum]|nr:hypothetical protein NXS19_004185 [Fusarium pseudograminearum]
MNEDPRLRRSSSQQEISFEASPESKASYMNSAQTQEEHDVRAARKRKHSVRPKERWSGHLESKNYLSSCTEASLAWHGIRNLLAIHINETLLFWASLLHPDFLQHKTSLSRLLWRRGDGRVTIPHQWKGIVKGTARRRLMAFNGPICGYGPTLQSDQARSLRGDAVSLVNAV